MQNESTQKVARQGGLPRSSTKSCLDIVYLEFRKAIVFHRVPTDQVMNSCLDKWTIRWMKNWLNHQAQFSW